MCGIAGFIGTDIHLVEEQTRAGMRSAILYRGRDAQGEWSDGRLVHLFHSRLSIIDLATGKQPMWDSTQRFVVVFNGEIYNFRELRQEYERKGVVFQTKSDTEVILEGFKRKGADICADLNGMFAFAIWDKAEKRLFLARDHLGKKPLFWYSFKSIFYFASTLDAFRGIPDWDGKIALSSVTQYVHWGNLSEDTTIYERAFSVPYASHCVVSPGRTTPRYTRYWRMSFLPKSRVSFTDLIDEYENLLTDAIRIRLRSDVPVGITFSGGVDSGTIASLCAKELRTPITCYTIDYHTNEDPSQETLVAERVCRYLNLDWQYIHFDYHKDLLRDLERSYRHYDQPSQLPLVYSQSLYNTIKPYATVVLSGNGADELFTGYIGDEGARRRELLLKMVSWTGPLVAKGWNVLEGTRFQPFLRSEFIRKLGYLRFSLPVAYSEAMKRWGGEIDNTPATAERLEEAGKKIGMEGLASGVESLLDLMMFLNMTCTMSSDTNYRLPDISGLTAQVEVRSPFLDYHMVEFAARLPHRFKVGRLFSPSHNKYLPKAYYSRKVPDEIAWAPKKGMGWNINWHKSICHDPSYLDAFDKAYRILEEQGIGASLFRDAWVRYRQGSQRHALWMMTGFMLGHWLSRDLNAPSEERVF